jgi:hypothetical protein
MVPTVSHCAPSYHCTAPLAVLYQQLPADGAPDN